MRMKGQTPLIISEDFPPETDCMTNRFSPTGGVINAHSIMMTNMMANQIGSIPIIPSDGYSTGIIINNMDMDSRKNPMMSKTKHTAAMNKPTSDMFSLTNIEIS
eukprot:GHVR01145337.1.p2 GENE.GHVR01145337.1~~GHVR01145337.1.p2  ORF type:complete len:104 (-),score=7.04 GHVR01145337.1:406-717(-)